MIFQKTVNSKFLVLFFCLIIINAGLELVVQAQDDDLDARVSRQMSRIKRGEKEGTVNQKQAKKLKDDLNDIALQIENARKKGNGKLSTTQTTKFDNALNQNFNTIQTELGAGKKIKESGVASGPRWSQGTDGAQDPKALRRQMKIQEARQLRQYGQAMQQVQEMQQQQYEKDMLQTLGQQRPEILKNKQQIEQIRDKTGAN
jgi:hypothetical protein